jgi:hypothetical protein
LIVTSAIVEGAALYGKLIFNFAGPQWEAFCMTILQQYRARRIRRRGAIRALVLMGVLLLAVVWTLAELGRARGSARVTPQKSNAPLVPAETASNRVSEWQALSPESERRLLAGLTDQAPLGVTENARAYYYLLGRMHYMTDAEVDAAWDPAMSYDAIASDPEVARGAVVQVQGHVLRLVRTELDASVAGLPAVWEGQVMDADRRVYSFVLTEEPELGEHGTDGVVQVRDALRAGIRGIYMQNIVYESRGGLAVTPLIIARRLAIAEEGVSTAKSRRSWPWLMLAVGAAAVMVVRLRCVVRGRWRHTSGL